MGAMQQVANAAYAATDPVQDDSGPYRLRSSTFQAQLDTARTGLVDAGCQVDTGDWIAGAFRPGDGATLGEHASGAALTGSLDLKRRSFTGTLDLDSIGERFSRYDATHRFVVDDADGFFVGYGARVEGRRGVFMGLRASCPVPVSAEAALAGWIDGSLVGLDPVDTGVLAGLWDVDVVCDAGATVQTWTVSGTGGGYAVAGADLGFASFDTATFTAASTYALSGPPLSVALPPGIDPIPRGTVVVDGADAFTGSLDIAGVLCSVDATRL